MTLNDLIISSLAQLDRGHDEQTMEAYRKRLTDFANDAQADIARAIGFSKTETVMPENGIVELAITRPRRSPISMSPSRFKTLRT